MAVERGWLLFTRQRARVREAPHVGRWKVGEPVNGTAREFLALESKKAKDAIEGFNMAIRQRDKLVFALEMVAIKFKDELRGTPTESVINEALAFSNE